MKSFIIALFLLVTVGIFVTVTSLKTVNRIEALLEIAERLPKTADAFFHADNISKDVNTLIDLWDKEFPIIVCTAGYENTNRCDEAIGALAIHFKNKNGSDFSVALAEFCDSLSRLRILEGIHWQGIF